jgi:hypothetical protein
MQLVVCLEAIEHVEDPDALLTLIHSKLARDGILIISTPSGERSPRGHSGNPHHHREFTLDEFRTALGRHFSDIRMFFQWPAGDPYDTQWSARQLARALVPVRVKSRLRRGNPLGRASFGPPPLGKTDAFRYRPLPIAYLKTLPGLRYETPNIWLAVCRHPRAAE